MAMPVRDLWKERKTLAHTLLGTPQGLRRTMFWLLWLYIVIFSVGPNVREALPSMCLVCLLLYYRLDWHNSTLRRFSGRRAIIEALVFVA